VQAAGLGVDDPFLFDGADLVDEPGIDRIGRGTIPLGALLAGTLGTVLGLRPTLWIMTAGLVAAATILLAGPLRRHRDLPTAPDQRPSTSL
jgi:hypothetical protein